jgi:hypothetical protein
MQEYYGEIQVSPDVVEVRFAGKRRFLRKALPGEVVQFRWSEITRIIAFKRDCLTVDSIRMLVELNASQTLEISEEMSGWNGFVKDLPLRIPGALSQDQWFTKVAFPAFALCLTELYPRPFGDSPDLRASASPR